MEESLRVVAYVRVSTLDKQHPESQLLEIREYCQSRGWKIIAEFIDRISGIHSKRPGLNAAMNLVRQRKAPVIVVTSLSRLGRSLPHVTSLVVEFDNYGTRLVSIREDMDFTSVNGKLMLGMFMVFAQFERDLIAERVRSGLAFAKYCGRRLGRPPSIDQKIISAARELLSKGGSVRSVAKSLRISPSAVHKILKQSRNEGIATTNVNAPIPLGTDQIHLLTKVPSIPN